MTDIVKYIIAGIIAGTLLLASGWGIVSGQVAARESRWNREVLCIGILGNEANTARHDPRVVELCETVGIRAAP